MRRLVVALAVVGATALTAPAEAHHDKFLTISGNGAGYVDVTFDRKVTLDTSYLRVQARGLAAGIYVRPLSGAGNDMIAVSVRDFSAYTEVGTFEAGRYRVYLLADKYANVRVLARGLTRDLTLRVAHRSPFLVATGRVDVRAESPVRYRGVREVRLQGRGSKVFTGYRKSLRERPLPTNGETWECLKYPTSTCDDTTMGLLPGTSTGDGEVSGWHQYDLARDETPPVLHQGYTGTAEPRWIYMMAVEIVL